MKTSQYPVLDNKPIDQWKVTELKEELKRRKLTTRGLKEELVRRLDEALRAEMGPGVENENENDNAGDTGVHGHQPEIVVEDASVFMTEQPVVAEEAVGNVAESVVGFVRENVGDAGRDAASMDRFETGEQLEFVSDPAGPEVGVGTTIDVPSEGFVSDGSAPEVGVESTIGVLSEGLISDGSAPELGVVSGKNVPTALVGVNVSEGLSYETTVVGDGLLVDSTEKQNGDSRAQLHCEDIKSPNEDVKLDSSVPNSQVSEVNSSLGFPVQSNISVSTDSVSITEKNYLKDNIIADDVKLESDLKPEMVHPSSNDLVFGGDESHPRDVEEPYENRVSVKETDNSLGNADMSQKTYSAELGSEKLNLDRSSGDDSMEEDALESKQIDSNYNSEEVGVKTEQNEATADKEKIPVETMDTDLPVENKGILDEKKMAVASNDKRKLSEQEAVVNKPAKRQHRWKTESSNVSEAQHSNISAPAASKDALQFDAPKWSISRSDSMLSDDLPKEREVPPSSKAATNSLRIDNFLRPFTLKAVQELLGKTGRVTSFWMDHIKTHCYVSYSSIEEAVETRNAVYNLQWPPNGGRQLVADFVEAEEVKLRLEPPPQPPAAPVKTTPNKAPEPPTIPQISPRHQRLRQRMEPALPPPPPMLSRPPANEMAPPPPPPLTEKVEAPIVTLDDLFRKTKATPRIYYLPLSEGEVAALRKSSEQ